MLYSYKPMAYEGVNCLCVEYILGKYLRYTSPYMEKVLAYMKKQIRPTKKTQIKRSKFGVAVRELNSSRHGWKVGSNIFS